MQVDCEGMEVLGREDCMALLAARSIGHVAFTTGALPAVLPVDYWVQGERVLFRTMPGSVLGGAVADSVIALGADDGGVAGPATWAVVVTGRATVVPDPPPGAGRVVAVTAELVSGRRNPPAPGGIRP